MAVTFLTATQSSTTDTLGTSNSTAIPASTTTNDVIFLVLTCDTSTPTITWPSGFVEVTGSPFVVVASNGTHYHVAWKRSPAGEGSGSYTPTFSVSTWSVLHAFALRGVIATGNPHEDIQQSVTASGSSSVPSINVTTTGSDMLIFIGIGDQAIGAMDWTPPTGPAAFTEVIDNDYDAIAWLADSTSGTRTVSGATASTTQAHGQMVIAIKPAAGGTDATATPTVVAAVTTIPAPTVTAGSPARTTAKVYNRAALNRARNY